MGSAAAGYLLMGTSTWLPRGPYPATFHSLTNMGIRRSAVQVPARPGETRKGRACSSAGPSLLSTLTSEAGLNSQGRSRPPSIAPVAAQEGFDPIAGYTNHGTDLSGVKPDGCPIGRSPSGCWKSC